MDRARDRVGWWLAALVIGSGCGRLDFDPVESAGALAITSVRPSWTMPSGGAIDVVLAGDREGATVTIDGLPCDAPVMTEPGVLRCGAPAHAPAVVELIATNPAGDAARFPGFSYLTPGVYQHGGPLDDRTSGVAIARDGSVYITGGTTGSLDGPNAGDFDVILIKYDAAGALVWVRQLGTALYDYARDVAVDPSGDITIVGYGLGDIDGDGTVPIGNDIFIARYSPDGVLRWVTQTGTTGDDQAWDLAVDDLGAVVVAGRTTAAFPGMTNAGGQDYVVLRYAPDGTLAWVRQVGTAVDDYGHSVAVAPDGTAFLVGYTQGALEAGQPNAGGEDLFVARYEVDGTRTWLHQRGTPAADLAQDVTVDSAGDVWVAGITSSALDGNPHAGDQDVFVTRFTATGTWRLTRVHGSAGRENTFGVAVDREGHVFVSCNTNGAFGGQTNAGGTDDFCMVAMDRDGTHAWTRIVGTPGYDAASSCAVGDVRAGLVFLSLITDGSLDGMPSRGGNDIAVAKFDVLGALR